MNTAPVDSLKRDRAAIDQRLRSNAERRADLQREVDERQAKIEDLDRSMLDDVNALEHYDLAIERVAAGLATAFEASKPPQAPPPAPTEKPFVTGFDIGGDQAQQFGQAQVDAKRQDDIGVDPNDPNLDGQN